MARNWKKGMTEMWRKQILNNDYNNNNSSNNRTQSSNSEINWKRSRIVFEVWLKSIPHTFPASPFYNSYALLSNFMRIEINRKIWIICATADSGTRLNNSQEVVAFEFLFLFLFLITFNLCFCLIVVGCWLLNRFPFSLLFCFSFSFGAYFYQYAFSSRHSSIDKLPTKQ